MERIEPDPSGGYVVSCPALSGCYSQGDSVEDVKEGQANYFAWHLTPWGEGVYPSENCPFKIPKVDPHPQPLSLRERGEEAPSAPVYPGGLKPAPTFFKKIFDFACPTTLISGFIK